ncbi:hypothetical protein POM88_054729 [Heracleum sosnowskyi]|uniref:Protein FAR1-RELATED SEQUENCE n=1 Tax=Heracleum sosnowskyi TaxID=360622 RepID=A0AAD8GM93_9APIA|nr:hypothetical protein POM88_054729 [Heracleum sosnowskyi]
MSPGGQRYFIPTCGDLNCIPVKDMVFESLHKAYKFYKKYGQQSGFTVRKSTEKKNGENTIVLKHFVCSREGFNDVNDGICSNVVKRRRTVSQRCGCKTKIVVKYTSLDRFFVLSFVEKHNHPLASETGRQFLRANREMSLGLRTLVFGAAKVNIGNIKSFSFAKELMGGYSIVGATLRDFRNLDRDLKCYVGERDGQMMIEKFKLIQETSASFYYAYDVDPAGHLMKLFWADAIGRRNFEIYGDAVSFDATFDTNKYNLIFAQFTGVDKHDKCVTFASCLLSHESVTDYSWPFGHFVKAMGQNHVLIITDQCTAMKVAVPGIFYSFNGLVASKHRLCIWHILQKFPVKLGNRLCKETDFMEKMKIYIWSSNIDIDEFERGWEAVFKEFKFEGSRYFHKQGDTLCEFWLRYQSAMDRQRNETTRLDHETNSSIPTCISTWFIEDDAADLFTRAIFYKFQEEIIASCVGMQIKRMSEEVDGVTHLEIRDVKVKDKLFKVSVSLNHVVCSCKKFVMCGILRRHAFCGLKQIGVTKFPRTLVLNRWTKIANNGTSSDSVMVSNDYFKLEQVSLTLTNIWFDFREAVNKAGLHSDRLAFVQRTIKQLNTDLDNHGGDVVEFTKRDHMAAMVGDQPSGELTVLVPKCCKNKGNYFKRMVSIREKAVMNSKKIIRKCKKCSALTHDSRTCPKKN